MLAKKQICLSDNDMSDKLNRIFIKRWPMRKILVVCLMMFALCGCSSLFSRPICVQRNNLSVVISKIELAGVIYYANGQSDLRGDDWTLLSQIAEKAKRTGAKVVVYGHASHHTKAKNVLQAILTNIKVSNNRAVKIMSGLWAYGVPLENIKTMAMFDTRPVAEENNLQGQAANRRSEIYLYW